ncbi:MAG: putative ATPase [Urechidicola sp.]|jgi:predicted ATPase|tara:strand:- start:1458 stop:2009 length:552 start_codon:yes stop_codon:yes gene_type:complete
MQQKIVITGGPGTGKTSIIKELEKRNYFCYHEVIRELTLEAKKEGSLTDLSTNPIAKVDDSLGFNLKILNGRINQFKDSYNLKDNVIFFDRGIADVLGYMDYFKQSYDDVFIKPCEENKYTKIIVLPPWEDIYISDGERFESYKEAVEIHIALENIYKKFEYEILVVPFGTIEERTSFILDSL